MVRRMQPSKGGGASLSQLTVERTIGKLATDPVPYPILRESRGGDTGGRSQLSPGELEALAALSPTAVTRFSESLDPRVRRLDLDATDLARPAERMEDDPEAE